jgi:hypothetical protein
MGERDFTREMDLVIERHTGVDTYQSRIVAQDIVSELLAQDPDLLNGWLQVRAADLLHDAINYRDRSRRARGVIEEKKQDFNDVLDDFVAGKTEPLRSFLGTMHAVDRENNRKKLRNMNRTDLGFLADRYQDRARENGFLAAFYRELSRRVGDRTVGDVFSEAQIQAMRAQFTGTDD